ncbi:MAG: ethanolamine utilization protein EutH [Mobilitalea sp.]
MNNIITYIVAAGAVLGGLDKIFGNKKGYGKKFDEGFHMIGPTALSMVGIICLSNIISDIIGKSIAPVFRFLHIDPAMIASVFAIDMGGYQLALNLAEDPLIGKYAGIILGATIGCTLIFTIPVGISLIDKEDTEHFTKGVVIGLFMIPFTLVFGGLISGLSLFQVLYQNIFIFLLAFVCGIGFYKFTRVMIKVFQGYVTVINILLILGLVIGAVAQITGKVILAELVPLKEAMSIVCSIGVFLLGSLPITLFVQRLFQRPITMLGEKIGLDAAGMTGLIVGCISPLPTLAMLKDMNYKSKIVNVAFLVSGTSALGAHMGFVATASPNMMNALLLSKLIGGMLAAGVAIVIVKNKEKG